MTTAEHATQPPTAERPAMPKEYGMPRTRAGLLAWETVDARLREARVYWLVTVRPNGAPRVRPVDGIWVDGTLYVGGAAETGWNRDLEENLRVSVHLDGVDDVAILEGEAEVLDDGVSPEVAVRLAAESNRKFPEYGMKPDNYIGKPAGFAIHPSVAFAWKAFPRDVTKFRFGPQG